MTPKEEEEKLREFRWIFHICTEYTHYVITFSINVRQFSTDWLHRIYITLIIGAHSNFLRFYAEQIILNKSYAVTNKVDFRLYFV